MYTPMAMPSAMASGVLSLCSPSPSASGSLEPPPPQLQAPPSLSQMPSSSRFAWLPTPQHSYPGPGGALDNAGIDAATGARGLASYPSWPMSSSNGWFPSSGAALGAGLQAGEHMDHRNPLGAPPPLFGAIGPSQTQNPNGWFGGVADASAVASSQMGKCFALLNSPHDTLALNAHEEVFKMTSSFASLLPPPALVPSPASAGPLPGPVGTSVPGALPALGGSPAPPHAQSGSSPYACRGCTAPILDRYLYRTTSNSGAYTGTGASANTMSSAGRGGPGAVQGPESPQQAGAIGHHGHKTSYPEEHWHGNCMRCRLCTLPLDAAPSCYSRNGSLYCKEDYTRSQASRQCARCKQQLTASDLVVHTKSSSQQHSNESFGPLVFHANCFACVRCGRVLAAGELYGVWNGALYCSDDYRALHQQLALAGGGGAGLGLGAGMGSGGLSGSANGGGGGTGSADGDSNNNKSGANGTGAATVPNGEPKQRGRPAFYNGTGAPKGRPRKRREDSKEADAIAGVALDSPNAYCGGALAGQAGGNPFGMRGPPAGSPFVLDGLCGPMLAAAAAAAAAGVNSAGAAAAAAAQQAAAARQKRMRTSFKHHQLRTMKAYFTVNHNPDAKDLKQLSEKTGLSKRVLQVWFQNARAKYRRGAMKQDGTPVKGGESLDDLGLGKGSSGGDGESSGGGLKLEQEDSDDRTGHENSPGQSNSCPSGTGALDGLDACGGGGGASRSGSGHSLGSRSASERDDENEEEMSEERDAEDDAEDEGSLQSSCSFDGSASGASAAYPFANVYGAAAVSTSQPAPGVAVGLGAVAAHHQHQHQKLSLPAFAGAPGPAASTPFHPLAPLPEATTAQANYYHFAS